MNQSPISSSRLSIIPTPFFKVQFIILGYLICCNIVMKFRVQNCVMNMSQRDCRIFYYRNLCFASFICGYSGVARHYRSQPSKRMITGNTPQPSN